MIGQLLQISSGNSTTLQIRRKKMADIHLQTLSFQSLSISWQKVWLSFFLCYKMYSQLYPYNQQNQIMSILSKQQRKSNLNAIRASFKKILYIKPHFSCSQTSVSLGGVHSNKPSSIIADERSSSTLSQTYVFKAIHDQMLPEKCFFECYQILEKIGQGCNATVYKCKDKSNQQICAVKKVKIEEDHILEFKRNFISIKQLNHPSFCSYKALYFGNRDRFAFLLMEYCPYPSLSECSISSEEQLKSIAKQLIMAVKYLHQHNICHRDIKPQNILYDQRTGKVKIIDFGISKKTFQRGVRRDMLTIIGTNFYFAPEIYLGGGYDQKVDLWALGVTIFKLITGYTPFQSEYHSQTISNILKGEVNFYDQIWCSYSPFAKDFVQRLLKEKSKRMTINQCQNHLWFQTLNKSKNIKLNRSASFTLEISEQFRQEIKKYHQARPKQEGACSQNKFSTKSAPIFNNKLEKEPQFQDFDNEDQIQDEMRHCISF